jgi:hypothetical protein
MYNYGQQELRRAQQEQYERTAIVEDYWRKVMQILQRQAFKAPRLEKD